MLSLATVSVVIITFRLFCFVVINKKSVVHFIANLTVNDHGNGKNLSTLLLYSKFTVSSRLRKHEDDLLRISCAMRHGQLESNDRLQWLELQVKKNQDDLTGITLELSQFKDELRGETMHLLFMIDDLEQRLIERSILEEDY